MPKRKEHDGSYPHNHPFARQMNRLIDSADKGKAQSTTPEPPAAGPTIQGDAAEMIDKAKVLISQMLGAATLIQRIRDIAECESDLEDIKQEQVKVHKAKNELLFLIKQLSENQSKGDEVKGVTVDKYELLVLLSSAWHHGKYSPETYDNWKKENQEVINSLLQPTPGQGEWISYESYMPPLAPPDECYNEQPWSIIVDVLLSNGREAEGVYDFTYRTWCEPEFEAAFDSEADVQVTHWRLKPPANKKVGIRSQ